MNKTETFYKAARPDGWDFFTGKTINYREAVGGSVQPPGKITASTPRLCSADVLHASRDPNGVFMGASLPLSLYRVEGVPVDDDGVKCGFRELRVVEELDPATVYEWDYRKAAFPTNPLHIENPVINAEAFRLLEKWHSVRHSVRHSVGDSVWHSVWDSVWASVGDIFSPVVSDWKYVDHEPGVYPFQPSVDLWSRGLVPSFDGKVWRLHGHEDARVLWQGTRKQLQAATE